MSDHDTLATYNRDNPRMQCVQTTQKRPEEVGSHENVCHFDFGERDRIDKIAMGK